MMSASPRAGADFPLSPTKFLELLAVGQGSSLYLFRK